MPLQAREHLALADPLGGGRGDHLLDLGGAGLCRARRRPLLAAESSGRRAAALKGEHAADAEHRLDRVCGGALACHLGCGVRLVFDLFADLKVGLAVLLVLLTAAVVRRRVPFLAVRAAPLELRLGGGALADGGAEEGAARLVDDASGGDVAPAVVGDFGLYVVLKAQLEGRGEDLHACLVEHRSGDAGRHRAVVDALLHDFAHDLLNGGAARQEHVRLDGLQLDRDGGDGRRGLALCSLDLLTHGFSLSFARSATRMASIACAQRRSRDVTDSQAGRPTPGVTGAGLIPSQRPVCAAFSARRRS